MNLNYTVAKMPSELKRSTLFLERRDEVAQAFRNLKADEALKFPCPPADAKKMRNFGNAVNHYLRTKKLYARTCIQNGFLYIYRRAV